MARAPVPLDPSTATADPLEGALGQAVRDVGRSEENDNLAWWTGAMVPSPNGTGGALGNALASQDSKRLERDKLMVHYLPLIQAAMQGKQDAADMARILPGGMASLAAAGAPASPAGGPAAGDPGTAPQDPLGSLTPGQVAALKGRFGIDLTDLYKFVKEPQKLEQGATYVDRTTGATRMMPKTGEGVEIGPGGAREVPNYSSTVAGIAGATQEAQERAKAGLDPMEVFDEDKQRMVKVPRASIAPAAAQPGSAPSVKIPAAEQAARDRDAVGALQAELTAAAARVEELKTDPRATPEIKRAAQADVDGITKELARYGTKPTGLPAGPTVQQKASAEAQTAINNSWLKTSYEPTISSVQASKDLVDSVRVSRQALQNMGSSGWGTELTAGGASVLAGLGIASDKAKNFAANAEVFQKTAMERLWTTLNEAKGPQTEGDAQRASKTYAQLSNTPKANEFILDLAEAKAARDVVKARFYQNALPIARDKGDLQEVDRKWAEHSPSIFSMPSMQRWKDGIK